VVLVIAVVISLVIGSVTSRIVNMGGPLSVASRGTESVVLPGDRTINLGKLEEQAKQAEAAARGLQDGKGVKLADAEVLKGYLPASVAGYDRAEVSASSGGVGAMQGVNAEGTYTKGDSRLRLSVTDMGAAGALAGLADAFDVKSSTESGGSYEKVGKVQGRLTQESYDKDSRHGEYSVMVANRFMVNASGDGVTMDELKAAVDAVGIPRLEGLAKAG
jgi:hypothetical protein